MNMKRILVIVGVAVCMVACDNNSGDTTKEKLDTLKDRFERSAERTMDTVNKKLDTLKDRFERTAERTMDTARKKTRDLKERVENKINKKDSI